MTEIANSALGAVETEPQCLHCGRALPYSGTGRPRQFCPPEQRNADGRPCRDVYREQQEAADAAGLVNPAALYRVAASRLTPAVEAALPLLTQYLEATAQLESAMGERLGAATAEVQAANERARTADERAERAKREAAEAKRTASTATENERTADRRARDAERKADDVEHDAWRRISDAQAGQARAETAAGERAQAVINETQRREAAEKALREARDELAQLRKDNTALQGEIRLAEKAQGTAEAAAAQSAGALARSEQHLTTTRDEADEQRRRSGELDQALTALRTEARAEADELRRRGSELDQALTAARAESSQLTTRAALAEQRAQQADAALASAQEELKRLNEQAQRERDDLAQARTAGAAAQAALDAYRQSSGSTPGGTSKGNQQRS